MNFTRWRISLIFPVTRFRLVLPPSRLHVLRYSTTLFLFGLMDPSLLTVRAQEHNPQEDDRLEP